MLTVFFDLSRIASLGAFFYLLMDMIIQWGVWRNLRQDIEVRKMRSTLLHQPFRDQTQIEKD